jgi:hypothetical protein
MKARLITLLILSVILIAFLAPLAEAGSKRP